MPNKSHLLLVVFISFCCFNQAKAWFWSKKGKEPVKALFIQNHIHIEKFFKDQNESIYEIKLDIFIPHPENGDIVVSSFVDESQKKSIKDVAWIIAGTKQDLKITKNSVKNEVNKIYEQLANDSNPGQAYERISQGKNIINRIYYFSKNDIIPKRLSSDTIKENYLELDFGNNDKKRIEVNKYIYQEMTYKVVELPVERSKPPKKKPEKKTNKVFIPKEMPTISPKNPSAPLVLSPDEMREGQANPYITPPPSEEAQDIFNLQNELEQFSKQIYPQNYSETGTESDYDQMQQMLDDDYYGVDEEEDEEFEY